MQHTQDAQHTREERIAVLQGQVERGEYRVPAEQIASSVVLASRLLSTPIGELSPRERECIGRNWRHRNWQNAREIEARDADRLRPRAHCAVHRTLYFVQSGNREEDCPFCRTARENADCCRKDFQEEEGMAAGMGAVDPREVQVFDTLWGGDWALPNPRAWACLIGGLLTCLLFVLAYFARR